MNRIKKEYNIDTDEKAFTKLAEEICKRDSQYLVIQDIFYGFGCMSGYEFNKDIFSYKHKDGDYDKSVISNEAFAHFFEAGMDYKEDKLNRIKKYFPNAYKVYQKMLEDALD